MQIVASEIVVPLKRRLNPKTMVIVLAVILAFSIGEFIYTAIIPLLNKAVAFINMLPDIVDFFFLLVFLGVFLTMFIRQMRAPAPYVRIGHEGIFTSEGPFLIRWTDIKELSPPTSSGSHHLRFVLKDIKAVNARANMRSRAFILAGIDERTLPISIDELLTAIQERFATELQEHSITIS